MVARIKFLVLLLATAFAVPLAAQRLRVEQPRPDCNVFERRAENFLSDHSYTVQPRIVIHAEMGALPLMVAYALVRAHFPHWLAASVAVVAIGVVPHVRSVFIQHRYAINPGDLAFDLWDRSTPFFWLAGRDTGSRSRLKAGGAWLAGYVALVCFSSP